MQNISPLSSQSLGNLVVCWEATNCDNNVDICMLAPRWGNKYKSFASHGEIFVSSVLTLQSGNVVIKENVGAIV